VSRAEGGWVSVDNLVTIIVALNNIERQTSRIVSHRSWLRSASAAPIVSPGRFRASSANGAVQNHSVRLGLGLRFRRFPS
jgi:hypothetical protein